MSDQKLLDLVEGNAKVINEIYDSVMTLRKAVAIVQTLLEEPSLPSEQFQGEQDSPIWQENKGEHCSPESGSPDSTNMVPQKGERDSSSLQDQNLNKRIKEKEIVPQPAAQLAELKQLKKVGIRHAEWDGESPHPYGCDGLEDDPDDDAGGEDLEGDGIGDEWIEPSRSVDIEPETTADNQTLSAPAGRKEPDQRRREDMAKKLVLSRTGWTDAQYIIRRRDFIRDTAGCIRRLGIDSRCRVDSFRLAAVMFEFSFFYGYITELEKR